MNPVDFEEIYEAMSAASVGISRTSVMQLLLLMEHAGFVKSGWHVDVDIDLNTRAMQKFEFGDFRNDIKK